MASQVQKEVYPAFELDIIEVKVDYPGAAPEEVEKGILQPVIRQVVVSYRDENYAYITKGIDANESIITTDISTVRQGARVQLKSLSSANASAD